MAQIPYNPVPTVESHETPAGPIRVNATPDMFGAAVGAALSQAGRVTDQASDEIYQRGLAMQQMKNEADANAAVSFYDQQAGQLHAQFSAQTGANAGPEALAAHTKALQDLRTEIGSNLSNPMAQQLYNQSSLSTMGRTIFNAAGHSAEQTKGYYEQGLQAKVQNTIDSAQQNPSDQLTFQAGLNEIPAHMHDLALSQGWSADVEQEKTREAVSKLYANRITGLSRQNPTLGQQAFDEAIKNGSLRGQDIAAVQRTVDAQTLTGGSKQIADGINDGSSMALGRGQVPVERAADAIAGIESGGNYAQIGKTMVTSGPYAGQRALGRYGIMPGNLPQWLSQAGLPQMTPEQFLANPAAQDKVFATKWPELVQKYGSANAAAAYWLGGDAAAKGSTVADANGTTAPIYVREFNANLAKSATTEEKIAAAQGEAGRLAPSLGLLPDYAKERIIAQDREQNLLATQAQRQTQNVLDTALSGIKGSGATPGGFEQWLGTDPKLQQAYQSLDGKARLTFQRNYNTQLAADNVPSQIRDNNMRALTGLAQNDPETFLDKNLYMTDLTASDRKELVAQRTKMLGGALTDPHVAVALHQLTTQMNAAGLDRKADPTGYDTFTGALANQLRAFQTQHQRQPNAAEIDAIGNRLLTSTVTTPRMFGGTFDFLIGDNKTPLYKATPPQPYIDQMRKQFPTASDDQIRQRYVRDQYRAAVGKEASANSQH